MRLEQAVGAGVGLTMQPRDYDTLRNAIRKGMNCGTFVIFGEWMEFNWEWRMLGDRVQVREKGFRKWNFLNINDLDHLFSGGVFGQRKELHIGFLCYDARN